MKVKLALVSILAAAATAAHAQVTVSDAWVRGTVAQQKTTGLFFKITSRQGGKLVAVASPVARSVELHQMSMKNEVMSMRDISSLALPAGKTVSLEPNGAHVMLVDIVRPLSAGDVVPATLTIEDAKGRRETVQVQAKVEALGAPHRMTGMSGGM
jgi:hypothetical protein